MKERVHKIFSQIMNVPMEQLNEETSPDNIKAWDSLMQMNLVLALEEEFGVVFTEDQIVEMLNLQLIVEILYEVTRK
jgi:acyl carrier protein